MTVRLWRIATEGAEYKAADATGTGARLSGGRWNRRGAAVVHAAPSIALAALEGIVHLNTPTLPLNRYLIRIDVPDDAWALRFMIDRDTAPPGWDAQPVGLSSLDYGDRWLRSCATLLLSVPSAVIPLEQNVLINPLHPDAARLVFTNTGRFVFDQRVRTT